MEVKFSWKQVKQTWSNIGKRLIKPYIVTPSKTRFGVLDPLLSTSTHHLASLLQSTKGVLDLPTDSVIENMFKDKSWYKFEENRELCLRLFLFNLPLSVVLPETYYDSCSQKCPHENCSENLVFKDILWDEPKLVQGITKENSVIFECHYVCKYGHLFRTTSSEYVKNLPSYVQKRYPYISNGKTTLNANDGWSLFISETLSPREKFLSLSRQFDFVDRVEMYLLYIQTLKDCSYLSEFPIPPKRPFEAKAGSNTGPFMHPSSKTLKEIRQSGVAIFKRSINSCMQFEDPGRIVGLDSTFEVTSKTSSASNALTAIISQSGDNKGKFIGYAVFPCGESHQKAKEFYEMISNRAGYETIKFASSDTCCNNLAKENLTDHVVSKSFNMERTPFADVFHKISGIMDCTNSCILSEEHRNDFRNIFFGDVSSLEEMDSEYPEWRGYFDLIELDGSLSPSFQETDFDIVPDMYARKLIAYAHTCVEEFVPKYLHENPNNARALHRWYELKGGRENYLLEKAISATSNKANKFVPQRWRVKTKMIQVFDIYCEKWFGTTLIERSGGSFAWRDEFSGRRDFFQNEVTLISNRDGLSYVDPSTNKRQVVILLLIL